VRHTDEVSIPYLFPQAGLVIAILVWRKSFPAGDLFRFVAFRCSARLSSINLHKNAEGFSRRQSDSQIHRWQLLAAGSVCGKPQFGPISLSFLRLVSSV
jgi:hypothetical protein